LTATTVTTPSPTVTTGELPARRVVEKPRFPLVWKLFGLTALLIVIVVAIAVGVTIQRAEGIARTTVNNSISGAAKLFEEFEKQRLGRLALPAELLGSDPKFVSYIQESLNPQVVAPPPQPGAPLAPVAAPAPVTIDLVSIADQLEQRRQSFGSDLLILLDDEGRVVARTDQPTVTAPTREDLYEQTLLVKRIVDDATVPVTTGVLVLGNKLYHAAVAPIATGANPVRFGYLINALAIDDAFANRIAESTKAGVIFASAGSLSRSSNAPAVGMDQMSDAKEIIRTGKSLAPSQAEIDQSKYVMTAQPLQSGNKTVGAAVFLRSLDTELGPFKQIENTLLAGGGVALLLAFILTWVIAKRVTRPIEQLAGIAQAVTAGDYSVHPNIDRSDEVGILGRSFAKMITALRDKAELEELYEQMAAKSAERGTAAPRVVEPAKLDEGTVLVTDLRGLPAVGEGDATILLGALGRVLRMQEAEVQRQDGEVREIIGHQLVAVFHGDRGVLHAIRAARAINEELASLEDVRMSIGVGIATGQFVTGGVTLTEETGLAIVGIRQRRNSGVRPARPKERASRRPMVVAMH